MIPSNSLFQYESRFIKFYSTKKVIIKANLKFIGWYIRDVIVSRWGNLFYRLKMLSEDILSFRVSRS